MLGYVFLVVTKASKKLKDNEESLLEKSFWADLALGTYYLEVITFFLVIKYIIRHRLEFKKELVISLSLIVVTFVNCYLLIK